MNEITCFKKRVITESLFFYPQADDKGMFGKNFLQRSNV